MAADDLESVVDWNVDRFDERAMNTIANRGYVARVGFAIQRDSNEWHASCSCARVDWHFAGVASSSFSRGCDRRRQASSDTAQNRALR
jgi:hypothetical protein